jgi:hypothetical protein
VEISMDNNVMIASMAGGVAVLGGLWWFFGSSSGTDAVKSKEEIAQLLEAQGYKIKEIDFDDGVYEVEAYQNGKEFEIKVDRTGTILKIEQDD